MKLLFISLLFTLGNFHVHSQNKNPIFSRSKQEILSNTTFSENYLYVICRGTTSKSVFIGRKFNLSDSNLTHVGIGILEDKRLSIFNVTTEKNKTDNLSFRIDSLSSFIESPDVYYLSIWKITVTKHEFERAKIFIRNTLHRKIIFDYKFAIDNADSLYCSEFCANLLTYVNKRKFSFDLTTKEIKENLIQNILGRKMLSYYPADFFINNRFIKPVVAYFIKN